MVKVRCRDCHVRGEESPDDPAPNLCPACYERRLLRISADFEPICELLGGEPFAITAWLEDQLQHTGGETPTYAHQHARHLLREVLAMHASYRAN